MGDVDGDGREDLVTAPGPGRQPTIEVYSGADGTRLRRYNAFPGGFRGGLYVAAGDVTGDGRAEVVAAQGAGDGSTSLVRIHDVSGGAPALLRELAPYPAFTGGVRVALADLRGDGVPDLITAPGAGAEPRARAFDPVTGAPLGEALVYDPTFTGGLFIGA